MEYSEKPVWTKYTREELGQLRVAPPDERIRARVLRNWDQVAKPLDGMGKLETLTARIGAVSGSDRLCLSRKAVLVLCADNGIVEEGVSQSGQEVTLAVARSMGRGDACVCRMAKGIGVDVIPVDIGINSADGIPGVLDRKVRRGTRNFAREKAMTEEETIRALAAGIDLVYACKKEGYRILATGELGIGNTTTSSAVAAALLRCGAAEVTGRGAGLADQALERKRRVIGEALERYRLNGADALSVLAAVGGLDLAGLAGVCIGGALFHVPVVLDGLISVTAALAAERMVPGVRDFLLPSHLGREPAMGKILGRLGLDPVICADLALGEGTGAVMLLSLLDMALCVYEGRTTFSDMQIEPYTRYE